MMMNSGPVSGAVTDMEVIAVLNGVIVETAMSNSTETFLCNFMNQDAYINPDSLAHTLVAVLMCGWILALLATNNTNNLRVCNRLGKTI
jgi:hypothetical protein